MNKHTNHHIIKEDGVPKFAVIPYAEYISLFADDDTVYVPHQVVKIETQQGCSLIKAWRLYRQLSQVDVAEKMGISQPAYSQIEKGDNHHNSTLEKLAVIFDCDVDQISE